jgi:HlyD family secretion protein
MHYLFTIAVVMAAGLLVSACGEAPSAMPKGPSAMKIQVFRAESAPSASESELIGRIVARDPAEIFASYEGLRVQKVLVDAGQPVAAGQVLVQLDGRQLRQERLQAEQARERAQAQVAAARAQQALVESRWRVAEDEARRYRAVAEFGAVSEIEQRQRQAAMEQAQSERDASRHGLAVAQAELAAAEAALTLAVNRESDADIRAPFAGIVSERRVEAGAVIQAAAGPLFRMARAGDREFEAGLDGHVIDGLRPGQVVDVLVTPSGQRAAVVIKGRIRVVDSALSDSLRRGIIRITFGDAWPASTPMPTLGSTATAKLQSPAIDGIALPATAVQFDPEPWVYVVDADNRIAKRRVGLAGNGAAVVSGLQGGETIVRSAGALLTPGQVIEPVLPGPSTAASATHKETRK